MALARLSGLCVFAVDYRLAPEHRFPAVPDDVFGAYEWLLRQGLSSGSLALAEDSAGGGLALGTVVRARDAGVPLPACVVCFSPWTDLADTGDSVRANDGRCAMFRSENFVEFARAYLGGASPRCPGASPLPLFAALHGLPPTLLQVGSTELLLDDARRVHCKIQEAGGASRLESFDGTCHGWHLLDGLVPEARTALRQAASFVGSHLR